MNATVQPAKTEVEAEADRTFFNLLYKNKIPARESFLKKQCKVDHKAANFSMEAGKQGAFATPLRNTDYSIHHKLK